MMDSPISLRCEHKKLAGKVPFAHHLHAKPSRQMSTIKRFITCKNHFVILLSQTEMRYTRDTLFRQKQLEHHKPEHAHYASSKLVSVNLNSIERMRNGQSVLHAGFTHIRVFIHLSGYLKGSRTD